MSRYRRQHRIVDRFVPSIAIIAGVNDSTACMVPLTLVVAAARHAAWRIRPSTREEVPRQHVAPDFLADHFRGLGTDYVHVEANA